jgi:succinoglycan biosynthesis transport protein ExoP
VNSLIPNPKSDYALAEPMDESSAPHASFPIQRLVGYLLRFWWVPVLTLALGAGAGAAYVFLKAPAYVSKARMWETVKLRLPDAGLFTEDVQNFLGTQTELLQSATLRELALERLRASTNKVAVPLGKDRQPLPVTIKVAGSAKSSVFMLEASSAQAAYTQAYLNELMLVYLEYKKNIRKEVSGDTLASITEQVQRTERDLKAEQDILMAFQRTNNLSILQQEGAVAGGHLMTLKTRLSDLQLKQRFLQATAAEQEDAGVKATNNLPTPVNLSENGSGPATSATAEHQTAFKELELLKMQRERLSKYLRPKHPKIAHVDNQIDQAEKMLEIYRRQNREQLAASRQEVQLEIDNVLSSINEWTTNVVLANNRIAEADRLKLNVQRVQSVYERLMLLVQNVGISRNIDQETLAVLEYATPARRTFTSEMAALSMSSAGGLGVGLGLILLVALRDDRLTTLREIVEKIGANILGQVPEVTVEPVSGLIPVLDAVDERHAYAESYRSLRSAILFMAPENEKPRVILITSAQPHEGKSTVAANLAKTLAMGGARVVLVDADLRKGTLHKIMGLNREPGLVTLLREPAAFEQVLQTNCLSNLSFISSGSPTSNSGDLLLGKPFSELLSRLRREFDYVLIDSSPIFAADDAASLAPKVDGTLFVVRSRFSRVGPVREALSLLYQRQAKIMGIVVNQADSSARSYYYYKYADYNEPGKVEIEKAES